MAVKNRVRVTVDGKSFTLVGYESEEHLNNVAAYIDEKIRDLRKNSSTIAQDHSLAYILTSLNVGDDYFKNLERNAALQEQKCEAEKRQKEAEARLQEAEKRQREAEARLQEAEIRLQEAEKRLRLTEKEMEQQVMQLKMKVAELEKKVTSSAPDQQTVPEIQEASTEKAVPEVILHNEQNTAIQKRRKDRVKRKKK
ncbi:MAG: cell division protein ZapA [Epulopiscium sp.]|jgi:cell division protein ZapA|nr:cell division protein ZapA [Candidatus Epulonipiscium sp.]